MMPDHMLHAPQPAPTSDDATAPPIDDKAVQIHDDAMATAGMVTAHKGAHWAHFANMALGLWLLTGIFALGYRSTALQASDAVSGALVIVLAVETG